MERTLSLTFTALSFVSPHRAFQLDMDHTEAQVGRRERLRFDLPEAVADQVGQDLETLSDTYRLEALFAAAIQRPSLADFRTALAQARLK